MNFTVQLVVFVYITEWLSFSGAVATRTFPGGWSVTSAKLPNQRALGPLQVRLSPAQQRYCQGLIHNSRQESLSVI